VPIIISIYKLKLIIRTRPAGVCTMPYMCMCTRISVPLRQHVCEAACGAYEGRARRGQRSIGVTYNYRSRVRLYSILIKAYDCNNNLIKLILS